MENFPVEILYRIFDNIDSETILLSIRPVCRLFRAVVNTYNRYIYNFESISKSNFHLQCRLIRPENVTSLILSNNEQIPDQISLFMSSVRLRQMTRLQSITFIGINELQLNNMFKRIHLNFLTSFTLHIEKYDDRRKKTTLNFLSSIMAQSNLRKVELNIRNDRISEIPWPLYCRIEHLIIHENITFDNLCRILSSASQLHKLILKQDLPTMIDHRKLTLTFPQITSLTIEQLDVPTDRLESFLMLTPSLIYLKLIGKECVADGKRWEQFIQINLPHLDKFQFFMDVKKPIAQTREDLQIILDSFRSSFWTKYKKWFIAGVFNINRPHNIQLYTIPICKSTFKYELDSEKVFVYTSLDISPSLTENINELNLSLKMQIHDN
ncbi:unnamed protein product, partial [Adineta steineri]